MKAAGKGFDHLEVKCTLSGSLCVKCVNCPLANHMEDLDVVRDNTLAKPKFTVMQNVNWHDDGQVQMKFVMICILGDVGEGVYG